MSDKAILPADLSDSDPLRGSTHKTPSVDPSTQIKLQAAEQSLAKGDFAAAMALCDEVLKQSPRDAAAYHMMGITAQQLGNSDLALMFIETALAAAPNFARAWYSRAVILSAHGSTTKALECARAAVKLSSDIGEAWDLIGQISRDQGNLAEARKCHERAIALQPNNPQFLNCYALLLFVMEELPAAYQAANKANKFDPDYPTVTLGNILNAMGYPGLAAEHFARTRAAFPVFQDIAINEARARLQIGDMDQGWKLWELRPDGEGPLEKIPLWQGQKVSRLLLHEEHKFGDLIQWLRYIPLIKNHADHIEAYVHGPLRRLCLENFPYVHLLDEYAPQSTADARCRWSSFPFFFGTALNEIPAAPYLTASEERRTFWRDKLSGAPRPRIGLVWGCHSTSPTAQKRSMNSELIKPLLACGARYFVSIQKDRPEKIEGIFDASPYLDDFADTAALISELDLVISVDTSAAHLTGALGKPLFLALTFNAGDWRWFLGREDSPWYGTTRLFRQSKPGDWVEVMEKISAETRKFIAGDQSVLSPPQWTGENLRQHPHALPLPQ